MKHLADIVLQKYKAPGVIKNHEIYNFGKHLKKNKQTYFVFYCKGISLLSGPCDEDLSTWPELNVSLVTLLLYHCTSLHSNHCWNNDLVTECIFMQAPAWFFNCCQQGSIFSNMWLPREKLLHPSSFFAKHFVFSWIFKRIMQGWRCFLKKICCSLMAGIQKCLWFHAK